MLCFCFSTILWSKKDQRPMPRTFICLHCGNTLPRNPRLKKQLYCSSRACQNVRRNSTNKVKSKKSRETRSLRQARNKKWRDTYPAHAYQQQYRVDHPEYVARNREQQKIRNKKREKDLSPMIVKTYALSPQPLCDGVYMGFEVRKGKIVKTYTYMAQRQSQQGVGVFLSPNSG